MSKREAFYCEKEKFTCFFDEKVRKSKSNLYVDCPFKCGKTHKAFIIEVDKIK